MKGEKLYELLDHLDDNLVLESAEIKRATWRRRLAVLLSVIAVIFVVWLVTTDAARNPRQDVGGQTGALQDGVYYVYAGSGMPLPTESRVPQGLVRYTPGQGKQLLVAYDDHPHGPPPPRLGGEPPRAVLCGHRRPRRPQTLPQGPGHRGGDPPLHRPPPPHGPAGCPPPAELPGALPGGRAAGGPL